MSAASQSTISAGGPGRGVSEPLGVLAHRRAQNQLVAAAALSSAAPRQASSSAALVVVRTRGPRRPPVGVAAAWNQLPETFRLVSEAGLLAAMGTVSLVGFSAGDRIPDLDIPLLGIGTHRFFVFHSAAGAWLLRHFVERLDTRAHSHAATRVAAALGAGGAFGIALHLVKDGTFGLIDGQKAVTFGIPHVLMRNTLVAGTFVDDDVWLLANAAYALRIGRQLAGYAAARPADPAPNREATAPLPNTRTRRTDGLEHRPGPAQRNLVRTSARIARRP